MRAKVGAVVRYCGHNGAFIADILPVGTAMVVRASAPVTMEKLNRSEKFFASATHHISDHLGGFWRPELGVFVVPVAALEEL